MKSQIIATIATLVPYVLGFPHLANIVRLQALSQEEVRVVVRSFNNMPGPQPLPPPIKDTSSKLVNDKDHPFKPELHFLDCRHGWCEAGQQQRGEQLRCESKLGTKQVDFTASLYPDLTPELRAAIKQNLLTYYQALQDPTCGQDFLFGQ
ncbi:hypothetical protein EV363DRAFT_1445642 [Boletus edulis]|nr:hypothetical protein EV363DRAFT_1445642 [Boletus edulis]